MSQPILLASASEIRAQMLRNARVPFEVKAVPVDEESIKASLIAEGSSPRDIADSLAEAKAQRVSQKHPEALVIGCDQVLDFEGELFSKPQSKEDARLQLQRMRQKRHALLSACVVYDGGRPVWRHVGVVRLLMRDISDAFIDEFWNETGKAFATASAAIKLEEEGVRLFTRVDGDYFTVLGMPLLELLAYLTLRGDLQR